MGGGLQTTAAVVARVGRASYLSSGHIATPVLRIDLPGVDRAGSETFQDMCFMKTASAIRTALIALVPLVGSFSPSYADSGTVTLTIYKAGWIIGASGGSGTLNFNGRAYALSTGGLDYGLVFGGSKTVLRGTVSNIRRPSDVAGVYGAAGAGLAVGTGARAIVLTNQKGAVLELAGKQTGLIANADLSGLAITLK